VRAPLSSTIQATIARRLEQLSPTAREVAGLAAAIGREFPFALLLQAGDQTEAQLVQAIDELLQRQMLYEQTEDLCDFTHDQLRQVAYHLLTRTRRRYWHRRIAQALTTLHSANLEAVSGQIAIHYDRAGEIEQALASYSRAAALAQRLSANEEAIVHLKRALDLLALLPLTPARNAQELNLRLTLGIVLNMARRYGDVEVEQLLAQVYHLSQQIGDPIQRFAALRGLHDFQRGRSNMQAAAPIGEELLALATQSGRADLLTIAYHELCMSALYTGDLDACLQMADRVRTHYRPEMHEFLVTLMPWNPYIGVLSNAHAALYERGYADQARQMIAEAIALAEHLAHPLSQMLALTYAAILSSRFEAPVRALQVVAQGMAVSQKYGVPHAISLLEKSRGAALIRASEVAQGVAILRQQLFRDGELVAEMGTPWYLAKLAEGLNQQGETDEAARLMALNFALVAQIDTPLVEESELHRVWGEIGWRQGRHEEARQRFHQAITIAQQHDEKLFELRATVSLCRLCQAQGNTTDVYERLVALYGWFTEGFDLPDLQDAKALLPLLATEVPTA
jgi:tetratricopeptide (TPR) repeat protein